MRIQAKVMLFVLVVSAASAGTSYFVQRAIMFPGFLRVEQDAAMDGLSRCQHALTRDAQFLADSAADYGGWDDTYRFIEDLNEEYRTANLIPETFTNLQLNLFAFVRSDRSLAWGEFRDAEGELIEASEVLARLTAPGSGLIRHDDPASKRGGIVQTDLGPMLIGSAAITTSDRNGEIRGAVLMGRFINAATVAELTDRTRVAAVLHPLSSVPEADAEALRHLSAQQPIWARRGGDALQVFALVPDMAGQPALLLRADQPLTISRRGEAAARLAAMNSLGGGLALAAIMWIGLSRLIVEPLSQLTRHAVRVGTTNDLTARLNVRGRDEISILAREFNGMVDRLADARAQMLEMAHRAGKSEVARSVLHNIGNVLNTVNVSASTVLDRLHKSEVGTLGVAAQMIHERRADLAAFVTADERGKHLPAFLNELAQHLAAEQQTLLNEMNSLLEALGHIRSVLDSQESHARANGVLEKLDPAKAVEQALALVRESLERHHVTVEREFAAVEPLELDRHRVLQILVNLLTNAIQAVKAGREDGRLIHVSLQRSAVGLEIRVQDNGEGIDPQNLERVFAYGYSTRPGGSGVGLHSAANLAREMRGSLTGASDGIGRGATFTLTLPMLQECAS
ncbi:MAG: HAMP domain-containing protein [Phycisphaerae bacterium]|jgi:sensor domain CHASE-containing protein/anti-sigma regulatory factor (Ser/Thr protein kinase)